jgi:hypothetical protein
VITKGFMFSTPGINIGGGAEYFFLLLIVVIDDISFFC